MKRSPGESASNMRKLCVGLLITLVLLGVVAHKQKATHPQPEYQGKPLAWCVTERGISTSEQALAAETALRKMGTNSLPYLLSELQRQESKAVDWLMRLFQRVRLFRIQYIPPSVRRDHAERALTVIGPTLGKRRLMELMSHHSRPVRVAAARALGEFPVPEGQEVLIACLQSNEVRVRVAAAVGLRGGGYFPHDAIVPLAACLKDSDAELRAASAETLIEYCGFFRGRIPGPAVSNLVRGLSDSSAAVRRCSATALGLANPQDEFVYAALTAITNDSDPTVRDSALSALSAVSAFKFLRSEASDKMPEKTQP